MRVFDPADAPVLVGRGSQMVFADSPIGFISASEITTFMSVRFTGAKVEDS
jgi:hypothetical protein